MIYLQNLLASINSTTIFNIGLSLLIILFFKTLSPLFAYALIKIFHLKEKNKAKIKSHAFYKPLKSFILVLGIYIASLLFKFPENIQVIIYRIFKICFILLTAKGFSNLFNLSSDNYENLKNKFNFRGNDTLFTFFTKFIKLFIYVIAAFIIISEFGYDLNGLATGLGISSVVVALAAQDLAKNIIGGFSIILDKPFDIGDFIEINGYLRNC